MVWHHTCYERHAWKAAEAPFASSGLQEVMINHILQAVRTSVRRDLPSWSNRSRAASPSGPSACWGCCSRLARRTAADLDPAGRRSRLPRGALLTAILARRLPDPLLLLPLLVLDTTSTVCCCTCAVTATHKASHGACSLEHTHPLAALYVCMGMTSCPYLGRHVPASLQEPVLAGSQATTSEHRVS